MHLVGFIIRNYHDARSPERQKTEKRVEIEKKGGDRVTDFDNFKLLRGL